MASAVKVEDVSFAYQEIPVLQAISLEILPGQFIGMIGPNGGGKTTLLKLILGFLTPDSGSVSVFGKRPAEARQAMSYVPQSLRFDKQFPISVLEVVLQGRLSHLPWYGRFDSRDKQIAMSALERVGIADLFDRPFGKLSGGQTQRTLIARALASEPQLLILDEPTANVDSQAEIEIYEILKQLQGEITIMMVTHSLQAAIQLVEKVICVQRTAFVLDPEQVCEHFALGLYHAPLIKLEKP